jgi:hypothetical protein
MTPHPKSETAADWVAVGNCNWLHEAQFLQSVLDAEGIEAFIPDQYTLGVDPLYVTALGGVRLLVRRADVERAKDVLASASIDRDQDRQG